MALASATFGVHSTLTTAAKVTCGDALADLGRNAEAIARLGILLSQVGRWQDALSALEEHDTLYRRCQIQLSPDHVEVLEALAHARASLQTPP